MTPTPDTLRGLGPSALSKHWPNERHPEWCEVCAHVAAWEADIAFANESGISMSRQLVEASAEISRLRQRLLR